MSALESWLHEATRSLLGPVLVALVALGLFTLVTLGGFAREALERRAARRAGAATGLRGLFARSLAGLGADAAATACELAAARRVGRLNLVARAGPTLGLIATLIPMGPALLALADDDVAGLARSLSVAFTATVSGLVVGLLCAAMASVRRHWYAADLAAVDDLAARLAEAAP